jgi:hypothetical protein
MDTKSNSTIYFSTAALIWLFGVLVFLPLAEDVDPNQLPIFVSLIVLVSFTIFLVRGLRDILNVINIASKNLTSEICHIKKLEKTEKLEKRIRVTLEAASILIVYLLYSPFLSSFHPSLNGIAIILTLMAIIWTLAKRR